MKQFDQVTAIFAPRRTDNLRPGLSEQIGKEFVWEALWLITPDDNELYAGEWAMVTMTDHRALPWWIPSGDLKIVAINAEATATATMTGTADAVVLPGTVERCHAAIMELKDENIRLEKELKKAEATIKRLEIHLRER